jgi:hypothetical protein
MRAVNAEVSVAGNHDLIFRGQFRQWQYKKRRADARREPGGVKTGEMPAFVQPYQMLRFGDSKMP